MRLIQFREPGPPSVMQCLDVPIPEPKSGEVLIRAHVIGVGMPDCLIRAGTYSAAGFHCARWRCRRWVAARRAGAANCEDSAGGHPFTGQQRDGRDACCFSQGNSRSRLCRGTNDRT